jgi:hypothetical protein
MRLPSCDVVHVCSVIRFADWKGKLGAVALRCHQVKDYQVGCHCDVDAERV